jgi:hypothetical protein
MLIWDFAPGDILGYIWDMVGYGGISKDIFGDSGYLFSTYPEKGILIRYPKISLVIPKSSQKDIPS